AVSPWLRPSWLTAEPLMTARTRSPSLLASERRLRRSKPHPSAQPTPSAPSEKALQRPSGAKPRSRLNNTKLWGEHITWTPPAIARSHSPLRNPAQARCKATSEDEHAVSTVNDGPCRPKTYETRPARTLDADPNET